MEEPTKREYFKGFTVLGLAMSVLMAGSVAGSFLYAYVYHWLDNQEAGVFRLLSWLFASAWTDVLVRYLFVLGLPYLLAWLILRRLPKLETPKRRLTLEEGLLALLIGAGIGYLLNFGGLLINGIFSSFTGKSWAEMNPTVELMDELTPSMLLYACILGPFMEEFLFRGLLLTRARRFGDRTAVVWCAVTFGLMHGNLTQFLYATFIGLVFGYLAVKTGTFRNTALLHMLFNSLSTLLSCGSLFWQERGLLLPAALSGVWELAVIGILMIGGAYFFRREGSRAYRELSARNWAPSGKKRFAYLNPGFLLYTGICGAEILSYLL